MNKILSGLRAELSELSDTKLQASSQHYFKESVKTYGIRTATVGQLAGKYYQKIKPLDKASVLGLCEELQQSGYIDESFIAYNWSNRISKSFETTDWPTLSRWVSRYVSNWAECDTLCNHTVGNFIMKYPEYINELKAWTKSDNRWVKRAAAVSLIVPARKGLFLDDVFAITDSLLTDSDDMVQKGYGWMLKVASQAHLQPVFDYVMKHKARMPRTALRYAIEKMPQHLREQAMAR